MSSCPQNPPAPAGYAVWKGNVPAALSGWAVALLKTVSSVPFGHIWTMEYGGKTVLARKDYHTWHYQPDGTLLTGICWPGITLYSPASLGFSPTQTTSPGIESVSPDPSYGVFDASPSPSGINWRLVAESGAALGGAVLLFALALRFAGRRASG